jgi:hypothetical protein
MGETKTYFETHVNHNSLDVDKNGEPMNHKRSIKA